MEYKYFTFDDISSSKYNVVIQNTGEDLSYPSQPNFDNQIISPLYQGTSYLAGVNKTARVFSFNCWADSINDSSVRSMLEWLSPDKTGQLILDYNPNYYYNVKLSSLTDFKHMAINEDGTSNYEFQLSFITIGDFAAISRTNYVIDQKANPLNTDDTVFLNTDNLAPIGVWDAATSKFKLFNYASEPMFLNTKVNTTTTFTIDKNDVAQYTYAKLTSADFTVDSQFGFVKIGSVLAESVSGVTATTNVGPMSIESGKAEVLYTTLKVPYSAPTITLNYTDEILQNTNLDNLYMIVQDGDYGVELLLQTMTEEERALYITEAINEQYNKINKNGSNSDITSLTFNGSIVVLPEHADFLSKVDITTPALGDVLIYNNATTKWENSNTLSTPRWTDLTFPFTQTRLGSNLKPDFDFTNVGLLFPQNDTSEVLYIIAQMPHSWKEGSYVNPHVHGIQKANQAVTFVMEYKWYNIGDLEPGSWSTFTMNQYAKTYTSGSLSQIIESPTMLSGAGKTISSILKIKLYRNDNTYTGDFFADQFDIHYQIDSYGSAAEYVK